MIEATCKGSWLLGSACGHCSRCMDEAKTLIPKLRDDAYKIAIPQAALNAAPRPTTKPSAEWMVEYMDWFFQTRGDALK